MTDNDIKSIRDELYGKIGKFFEPSRSFAPNRVLFNISSGLGKTQTTLRNISELLKKHRLHKIKVAIFVPDQKLSYELLGYYYNNDDLVGLPCMIRGRGHYNDVLDPPCEWAKLFLKSDLSRGEYDSRVGLISESFCKQCEFKSKCEYNQQFVRARSAPIVFFPHQYLFLMNSGLMSKKLHNSHDDYEEALADLFPVQQGIGMNSLPDIDNLNIDYDFSNIIFDDEQEVHQDSDDQKELVEDDQEVHQDSDDQKELVEDVDVDNTTNSYCLEDDAYTMGMVEDFLLPAIQEEKEKFFKGRTGNEPIEFETEDLFVLAGVDDACQTSSIRNKPITKPSLFSPYSETRLVVMFSHVIVDEDIVSSLILDNTIGQGVFACDRQDSTVVSNIIYDVENGADMYNVLRKYRAEIHSKYKRHRVVGKKPTANKFSDLSDDSLLLDIANYKRDDLIRTFFRMLYKASRFLERSNGLGLSVNNVWVDGDELRVGERRRIHGVWRKKPMLFLDATCDSEIVEQALGMKLEKEEVKPGYHDSVYVIQVFGSLIAKTTLEKDYRSILPNMLSYLGRKKFSLITHKSILSKLKSENLIGSDVKTAHFGNIRGTNIFEDDEILVILGRYQINGKALEEKARMLFSRTEEPLNFDYTDQEFIYRMADGKNKATMQRDYLIGSNVWKLNNMLSRAETLQAIFRLRLFDGAVNGKKKVWVFTSQVLDLNVSKLVSHRDVFPVDKRKMGSDIEHKILSHLQKCGDVMRWKPKELATLLGVEVSKLRNACRCKWFRKSNKWSLVVAHYDRLDRKKRKRRVKDRLIIKDGVDVDEGTIQRLNPGMNVENVLFTDGW